MSEGKSTSKKNKIIVYRDAVTGRFVSEVYAKKHPSKTFKSTITKATGESILTGARRKKR